MSDHKDTHSWAISDKRQKRQYRRSFRSAQDLRLSRQRNTSQSPSIQVFHFCGGR